MVDLLALSTGGIAVAETFSHVHLFDAGDGWLLFNIDKADK